MDYWKLYCKIKTECKDDQNLFNERMMAVRINYLKSKGAKYGNSPEPQAVKI
jgi:hypothetical protein